MNKGYVKQKRLGEGTYAVIYLADMVDTLSLHKYIKEDEEYVKIGKVAIKRIKRTEYTSGIEISAIREIRALQQIKSKYVLKMLDIFTYKQEVNLVLEYVESNLEIIIKNRKIIIMPGDIKAWMLMILKGLYACHRKFIAHRDIKPANILVGADGTVKIADFGLARDIDRVKMTSNVVTRWYRAPELILGSRFYTFAVDVWATGCVFAELFLRTPFLPGGDDFAQLECIFKALGTPTEKEWPNITKLPNYVKYPSYHAVQKRVLFSAASEDALGLLDKMLVYDPSKRITVLNALKQPYFTNKPRPTKPGKLPFYSEES